MPQTQPPFQRSEDHSPGREHVPKNSRPFRDSLYLVPFIVWLHAIFSVFVCIHKLITSQHWPNPKWEMTKHEPVDFLWERIICSIWQRGQWQWIASVYVSAELVLFKPAESLSAEMGIMIDWAVIEIVQKGAPVRNSFVSCDLRKSSSNVRINPQIQATF